MKNIFKIMKDYGLNVPENQKKDFEKTVLENYKTIADYDRQTAKLCAANEKMKADRFVLDSLKEQWNEIAIRALAVAEDSKILFEESTEITGRENPNGRLASWKPKAEKTDAESAWGDSKVMGQSEIL